MGLRSVTWILIIGYLAALAITAPTSYEEHPEEATTVSSVALPAVLPTEKKIRREVEKQDEDKSEEQKSEKPVDDLKKPTESAYTKPTEASSRLARDTDERKSEPAPPKPSGDTPDAKKDDSQHRDKRETEQKKDEAKKPTPTENKPDNRPQRDTTGGRQPQKQGALQPTANNGAKKEEKNH